jgi:hypothetical protein
MVVAVGKERIAGGNGPSEGVCAKEAAQIKRRAVSKDRDLIPANPEDRVWSCSRPAVA